MKKLLISLFAVMLVVLPFGFKVKAMDTNIISGGDFEGFIPEGQEELPFGDPAFIDGPAQGYGSLPFDSNVKAVKDPKDPNNTVLMFSKTREGGFSSFFKFCQIKPETTYEISFKFMVEGTTDNFGMRFAGAPTNPNLDKIFFVPEAIGTWTDAKFEFTTEANTTYDSIGVWFNTMGSLDNKGYLDNMVIKEKETAPLPKPEVTPEPTKENIITGGNFEGFLSEGEERLELPDPAFNGGIKNGWGSGNWDSHATVVKDPKDPTNTVLMFDLSREGKGFASFFKFCPIKPETTYVVKFRYMVEGTTDNFGMRFSGMNQPQLEKMFYTPEAIGKWTNVEFELTTNKDTNYDSIQMWFNTLNSKDNKGYLDDLVIAEKVVEPTPDPEPVDPEIISIKDVLALPNDSEVITKGVVLGKTTRGYILSDNESMIYVYAHNGDKVIPEIGTEVKITGTRGFYNGDQIVPTKTEVLTPHVDVKVHYLELTTNEMDAYVGGKEFVTIPVLVKAHFEMKDSGKGYYFSNLLVEGTKTSYSINYLSEEQETELLKLNGKDVIFKGFAYGAKNNRINVVLSEIEEVLPTPEPEPTPEPTKDNLITSGDFEGFIPEGLDTLPFGDPCFNGGIKNGWGSGAWDSHVTAVKDPKEPTNTCVMFDYSVEGKAFASFFKFAPIKAGKTYIMSFDYMVIGNTDNFGFRIAGAPNVEQVFHSEGETDGWKHFEAELVTDPDGNYDSIQMWFNTLSDKNNRGYVDNIVLKEKEVEEPDKPEPTPEPTPEPENPFDPNKTYYESKSMTLNGDFEKFDEGQVLTEEQLEGAWGTVSLDNSAVVKTVDGSKVLDLTKGQKLYTSAFLILPELQVGDMMRVTYEMKLVTNMPKESYKAIDSCLVGGANISYYLIDYRTFDFEGENKTTGEETIHYPVKVEPKENGWVRISFDYVVTRKDLIQTNSIRWLFTAQDPNDHMYIDNVNLYALSETPWPTDVDATDVSIDDGATINLNKGESRTLKVTVLPEDCTNKTLTFKSSNDKVATVDANGKVTAISKGACSITVTTHNGLSAEIAIVVKDTTPEVTPEEEDKPKRKGCSGSVIATISGLAVLTGAAFILRKKKEEE